jgi:CDP-diacylglycerol--glycerol-3-phosphate 3-phosphatidyltransferase
MNSGKPIAKEPDIEPLEEPFKDSVLTLPNVICFARLLGALVLIGFACAGWSVWFVLLFLFLGLTDLLDGTLARWLHQRSDFGARLDSVADLTLMAVLIFGAFVLSWEQLRHEGIWLAVAIGSYVLATVAGLWKFGRFPSYHTYAAKAAYGIALVAGVSLLMNWSVWPLRVAAISVTLANLESTAITCVLKQWQADVLTLGHVWPSVLSPGRRVADNSTTEGKEPR